jgi:subtilisin-like proprotein convertase family protein
LAAFVVSILALSATLPAWAGNVAYGPFSSTGQIIIQDNANAAPYPSTVTVSGVVGTVTNIVVKINGLTHPYPNDIDMLLVRPDGARSILMSDVGGTQPGVIAVNLTFADSAGVSLNEFTNPSPGTYKPSNFDPAGNVDSFAPIAAPYGFTLNALGGAASFINGTWNLYVVDDAASDYGSISGWSIEFVASDQVNQAPTITSPGDQTMAEDNNNTYTNYTQYNFTASDLETPGGSLTFTKTSSNQNVISNKNIGVIWVNNNNFKVVVTNTAERFGDATITLVVSDGALTASTSFKVTVTPVNDVPTITAGTYPAGTTLVLDEDAPTQPTGSPGYWTFTISDTLPSVNGTGGTVQVTETPNDQLSLMANTSNKELIPAANVVFGGSGNNRTVSITPAPNQWGTAVITLTVTDTTNNQVPPQLPANLVTNLLPLTIIVNPVNDPPTIGLNTNIVSLDEDTVTNVVATVSDVDNTNLVVYVVSTNQALIKNFTNAPSMSPTRTVVIQPQPDAFGTNTVSVRVWDGTVYAETNLVVEVRSVVDPLSIVWTNSVALNTINEDFQTFTNVVIISDPDNASTTLTLVIESQSPLIVPNDSAHIKPSPLVSPVVLSAAKKSTNKFNIIPATNANGTVTIKATVTDSVGPRTTNVTFELTINAVNDNPSVLIYNDPLPFGAPYFVVTNVPPGSTVQVIQIPEDGQIIIGTNIVVFDPETPTNSLTLRAYGNSTMFPIDSYPLLTNVYTYPTNIYYGYFVTNVDGTISRPIILQPATNVFGTNEMQFVVTDGGGLTGTNSVKILVANINDAPWFVFATTNMTIQDGLTNTLPFTVADAWGETPGDQLITSTNGVVTGSPMFIKRVLIGTNGANRTLYVETFKQSPSLTVNVTNWFNVIVTDTDPAPLSTSQTIQVVMIPRNDPPIITAPATAVTLEDNTAAIGFSVFDIEGNPITMSGTSGDLTKVANSGIYFADVGGGNWVVFAQPLPNQYGHVNIILVANDGVNNSQPAIIDLNIISVEDAPSIGNIANQTGNKMMFEDTPRTIALNASDPETPDANLNYQLVVDPASDPTKIIIEGTVTFDKVAKTMTITPKLNLWGSNILAYVIVTDGAGLSSSNAWFQIDVALLNDVPVITGLPATIHFVEDMTGQQTFFFTLTDVENKLTASAGANPTNAFVNWNNESGVSTYNWTGDLNTARLYVVSSNLALVPTNLVFFSGTNQNRRMRINHAYNKSGTNVIGVVAVDEGETVKNALNYSNTVVWITVEVEDINDPPSMSNIPDQTTDEDVPVGPIMVTLDDPETLDYNNLAFTASTDNQDLLPNIVYGGTNAIRFLILNPGKDKSGTCLVTVRVTDEGGLYTEKVFRFTVIPKNDPPTFANFVPSGGSTNLEDNAIVFTFEVLDKLDETPASNLVVNATYEFAEVFYTLTQTPNISGIPVGKVTMTVRPFANYYGEGQMQITVTDNGAGEIPANPKSNTAQYLVRWTSVNDNPTITLRDSDTHNTITSKATSENQTATIEFVVADVAVPYPGSETPASNLVVIALSSDESILKNSKIFIGRNDNEGFVLMTPETNKSGVVTVTFTVTDQDGGQDVKQFVLNISDVNQPPDITGLQQIVTTVEDVPMLNIPFSASDVETAPELLNYSFTSALTNVIPNGSSNIVFKIVTGNNQTLSVYPALNQFGTNIITIIVSDGSGSDSMSFLLQVASVNDEPVISTIADKTTATGVAVGPISFTVNDAETPAANIIVTAAATVNPGLISSIVLGGSGQNRTITVTPAGSQTGQATITVTANDTTGKTATEEFLVTIQFINTPPVISNIADLTTPVNGAVTIPFTINDNETPAAMLALNATSSNPTVVPQDQIFWSGSGNNRTLFIIPGNDQSGTSTITITVTDGHSASASDSFVLTVALQTARNEGDFNRDGKADLLLQHNNGTMAAWFMNGTTVTGGAFFNPSTAGTGWKLITSADFNRDDSPDLLFQHTDGSLAIWYMNGMNLLSGALVSPAYPGTGWSAVGAGDFNNDGKMDLVFQHTGGTIATWYMDGRTFLGGVYMNPTAPADSNYRVVGVADMNADGKPDLLFQHTTSNQLAVWFMNGINLTSGSMLVPSAPSDASFKAVALADYNGDGKADIVFYNNQVLATWFMDGATMLNGAFFNTAPGEQGWNVVGP